jgi:hypothetical protein
MRYNNMLGWEHQNQNADDYSCFIRLMRMFFAFFLITALCQTGICRSAEKQIEGPNPGQSNASQVQGNMSNTLQFMGLIDVGERQIIALMPGEVVDASYCKQGDTVKKGDLIVKLNNDSITNAIADLILKRNRVKEGEQQLHFAELEKLQREKQLQRVEGLITSEKSLKNQVAGYTSPVMQQLETQRLTLQEQLEISTARIAALKENNRDNEAILKSIKNQIDDLEMRLQNLTIKAPFNGRIFSLNSNLNRIPPGGMVCELRSDSFYVVRGKIIQHQRNLIKVGDMVKVALESSPNDSVEGVIESIEYIQEHREMAGYSSFEVLAKIDSPAKWMQSGMMVSVSKQILPAKNN